MVDFKGKKQVWNILQVLILLYIAFGAPFRSASRFPAILPHRKCVILHFCRIAFEDDLECNPGIVAFDLFTGPLPTYLDPN